MKAFLATLISMALFAGVAGQVSAATAAPAQTGKVISVAYADEHDFPSFGSQQWWQQQQDRG
jgi:hypothetical protein